MDAFYASVEEREDPSLKGKPVIVAFDYRPRCSLRCQLRCASVWRSQCPAGDARRPTVPRSIFIPPRHKLYAEVSREIHSVFEAYTPPSRLALDEAFLDITASQGLFGEAKDIAGGSSQRSSQEQSWWPQLG